MIDSRQAFKTIQEYLKEHPVRAEQTGERNLEFSRWLRENCRPSKGGCKLDFIELGCFVAFDLDFILYDYQRKMLQLLEVKTHRGVVRFSQNDTMKTVDKIMRAGAHLVGVSYLGLHVLRLDRLQPFESTWIEWDDQEIDQETCWRRINMLDELA